MAMQKSVEGADGRLVDGAYWVPVQINVGVADFTGNLVFYGYASQAARAAGKAPVAGAVKSYSFTKAEYLAATQTPLGALFPDGVEDTNIMFEVLARFAYGIALTRLDTPDLNEDGTPKLDENEKPIMKSFFADADAI